MKTIRKVLILEDTPFTLGPLVQALSNAGYEHEVFHRIKSFFFKGIFFCNNPKNIF